MTPSTDIMPAPSTGVIGHPPPGKPVPPPPKSLFTTDFIVRLVISLVLVVGYFWFRHALVRALQAPFRDILLSIENAPLLIGSLVGAMGVWLVAVLLLVLVVIWRKALARDKRFYAPLLITSILFLADAAASILEMHHSTILSRLTAGLITSYSPTFITIVITMLAEMLIGRFFYGKWPHLASAYISGISAGILIKSPELWPFVMCGLLSITSKYVLRIGERHLWNPTNLGVTLMLFLAPQHVASLSVEAGNEIWAVLVIWVLGAMILYNLGLLHVPVAFVLTFVPLAFLRAWVTGQHWAAELAPVTSPMFQLFIFFMITDPKTITKRRWSQVLVAVLVGIAETFFRLAFRDKYSLYHSLFTVGPISNLVEIGWNYGKRRPLAGGQGSPDGTPPRSGCVERPVLLQ